VKVRLIRSREKVGTAETSWRLTTPIASKAQTVRVKMKMKLGRVIKALPCSSILDGKAADEPHLRSFIAIN